MGSRVGLSPPRELYGLLGNTRLRIDEAHVMKPLCIANVQFLEILSKSFFNLLLSQRSLRLCGDSFWLRPWLLCGI